MAAAIEKCGICLRPLIGYLDEINVHPDERIAHIFHQSCLLDLFQRHIESTLCPLCRKSIDYHKVFPRRELMTLSKVLKTSEEDMRRLDPCKPKERASESGQCAFYACMDDFSSLDRWMRDHEVSNEDRGQALRTAAQHGKFPIVERLLRGASVESISAIHLGNAVISAAMENHSEILQLLLTFGPVEKLYLGTAREFAEAQGFSAIVAMLDDKIEKG